MSTDTNDAVDGPAALTENSLELVALRKFIYTVAGYPPGKKQPDGYDLLEPVDDAIERIDDFDGTGGDDVPEDLVRRVDELEDLAETAHALAQSQNGGGEVNKTEKARKLTRNELVRRAVNGAPAWGGITVSVADVQDMAKPELEIRYQLVDNAWGDLVETWECFERTTADGNKALKISKKEISRDLARLVEHDLERDDVVQRLFSEIDEGG
jgi:hypothetical protein